MTLDPNFTREKAQAAYDLVGALFQSLPGPMQKSNQESFIQILEFIAAAKNITPTPPTDW